MEGMAYRPGNKREGHMFSADVIACENKILKVEHTMRHLRKEQDVGECGRNREIQGKPCAG
jgi:hypothetical protein